MIAEEAGIDLVDSVRATGREHAEGNGVLEQVTVEVRHVWHFVQEQVDQASEIPESVSWDGGHLRQVFGVEAVKPGEIVEVGTLEIRDDVNVDNRQLIEVFEPVVEVSRQHFNRLVLEDNS